MRDQDPWRLHEATAADPADEQDTIELAVLIDAQRAGAAWFGAEFARREEEELRERESMPRWRPATVVHPPVDASVEDDVVGGTPRGLGIG